MAYEIGVTHGWFAHYVYLILKSWTVALFKVDNIGVFEYAGAARRWDQIFPLFIEFSQLIVGAKKKLLPPKMWEEAPISREHNLPQPVGGQRK